MGKFISFGKLNKYSIYILVSVVFLICNKVLYGYNHNNSFEEVKLFNNYAFSKHILIHYIFSYFGTFLLGIIFYKIHIYKNKSSNKDSKVKNKRSNSGIKLIYNRNNLFYNSDNLPLHILLIIFLWVVEEHLIDIYSSILKDLDFWMIELLIISYINNKFFKIELYSHQRFVFYLNIIPCIFKIITIILSFVKERNENITNKKLYTENPLYLIGIIFYFILIILRSYVNTKIKWLMDSKYISIAKLIIIYGFIGTIFSSIACTITTFVNCPSSKNIGLCKVELDTTNDNNNIKLKYYDNFSIYFNKFEGINIIEEIVVIILGFVTFFFNKYYSLLIIKYLTPVYIIFSFPMFFLFKKIILIFNTLIRIKAFFKENEVYDNTKFFLDISGDIIAIIGFLIYLEIIILNFWKLNYNVRLSIIKRGIEDSKNFDVNYNDDKNEEEQENDRKIELSNVTKFV